MRYRAIAQNPVEEIGPLCGPPTRALRLGTGVRTGLHEFANKVIARI